MKTTRWVLAVVLTWLYFVPTDLWAQSQFDGLLLDLKIVEKESAAAKEVRLKWISEERTRIREELRKFDNELADLKKIVPDPIKQRVLPPAIAKAKTQEQTSFNNWASNNDPAFRNAITRGPSLNALLRVLGPIAHYRKLQSNNGATTGSLPSLSPSETMTAAQVSHYRMNPATSAGSQVVLRPNQLPLTLEWPTVMKQNWKEDCDDVNRVCTDYVKLLGSAAAAAAAGEAHVEQAELLDDKLILLQRKVQQKKRAVPADQSIERQKRNQMHRDLQDSLRYLETVRATAERFKNVPSDYRVIRFAGGTVEDFLDFCFTHGMIFQAARPGDEDYYSKLFLAMKDYAHDIQYVEDWKSDIEQRIKELNADDQKLVWRASEQ